MYVSCPAAHSVVEYQLLEKYLLNDKNKVRCASGVRVYINKTGQTERRSGGITDHIAILR